MPTQTYFEMLEMLQAEETKAERVKHLCSVCLLSLDGVDKLLHLLSLENVNDVDTRLELRRTGGFCNRHAYQWASLHDALGTAIIYEDLLREAGKRIERGELLTRRGGRFGRAGLPANPFEPCPMCARQREIESRIIADFAEGFATESRFREAYAAPQAAGLCLSHYCQAANRLDGPPLAELTRLQQTKFEATQNLLRQIIEKMDAARSLGDVSAEEREKLRAIGDEREALTRAVWQMVGLENVF